MALATRLYAGTLSRSSGDEVFNWPVKRNSLPFQKLSKFSEKQRINTIKDPNTGKTNDIGLKCFIILKK